MTRRTLTRWLSSLAFSAVLAAGTAGAPTPARAQEPPAEGGEAKGEGSGRSGDGYIATMVLAGVILFAVGKSARR